MNQLNLYSIIIIILFLSIGCNQAESNPISSNTSGLYESDSEGIFENLDVALSAIGLDSLSSEEISGVLFMREEEKLARDVYAVLGSDFDARVFQNITKSEQRHMDAVKMLINRYGLTDPVGTEGAGVFVDNDLQALHDALLAQGKQDLISAYKVGATIEEVDIVDLQKHLALTNNEDITLIYNNLMRGSRNHLRAFVRNLASQGVVYTPQYLSQTEFDQIVNNSI